MKIFTRGAAGLAATLATAVVVSMVPGAEAAPAPSSRTAHQAPTSSAVATTATQSSKAGSMSSRVNGTFNHGRGTVHGTFVPQALHRAGQACLRVRE